MRKFNVGDLQEELWSAPHSGKSSGQFAGVLPVRVMAGKNLKIRLTPDRKTGFLNKRPHFRAAPIQKVATKSVVFSTAFTVN